MRNVLLALGIVLIPFAGHSQTFLTQSGTSDTVTGYYDPATVGDLFVTDGIKSASSSPVTITWHVTDSHLDASWKVTGFCDNYQCYNNDASANPPKGVVLNGTVYNSQPYTNSTYGDFHVQFDATSAAANTSAWVKVEAKDFAGIYERNLVLIGRKSATGVVSYSSSTDDIVLYPNPAHDAVNVIYDSKSDIKTIAVFNLIGKLMGPIYKPSSSSSAKIDLDDIPNGVYFIRLMNSQGHVVATRRFTHQ